MVFGAGDHATGNSSMIERVVIGQAASGALTVGELRGFVALLDGVPDDVEVRARTRIRRQTPDGLIIAHVAARWTA